MIAFWINCLIALCRSSKFPDRHNEIKLLLMVLWLLLGLPFIMMLLLSTVLFTFCLENYYYALRAARRYFSKMISQKLFRPEIMN